MKRLIIWLAKVFNANIEVERIVEKEVVEYRYLTQGEIVGDVFVDGDLIVKGNLDVTGNVTFKKK